MITECKEKTVLQIMINALCLRCTGDVSVFPLEPLEMNEDLTTKKIPKSHKRSKEKAN